MFSWREGVSVFIFFCHFSFIVGLFFFFFFVVQPLRELKFCGFRSGSGYNINPAGGGFMTLFCFSLLLNGQDFFSFFPL